MARQALTIIGAVVGAYFGNPQLGMAIGAAVGGFVDPEVIKTPSVRDVQQQTAQEGVPCPLYDGTVGGSGNMVYCAEPQFITVRERQGKGGPVVESERVILPVIVIRVGAALRDGPGRREGIPGLIKVWEDDKLVYDISPTSTILAESAEYANGFAYYPGDETQLPDPDLEAVLGATNAVAYRGRAIFIRKNYDATDRRGTPPNFRFEVTNGADEVLPVTVTMVTGRRHYTGSPTSAAVSPLNIGWSSGKVAVRVAGNGMIAAAINGPGFWVSGAFQVRRYDPDSESWVSVTSPYTPSTYIPDGIAWSPPDDEGNVYLAILTRNAGEEVVVLKWDGASLTQLASPSEIPSGDPSNCVAWDVEGQRLAFGTSGPNQANVYDFVDGELVNLRSVTCNGISNRLDWQPVSNADYFVAGSTTRIIAFRDDRSSVAVAAESVRGFLCNPFWDSTAGYVVAAENNSGTGQVSVFQWTGEVPGFETLDYLSTSGDTLGSMIEAGIYKNRRVLAIADGTNTPKLFGWSTNTPPNPVRLADMPASASSVNTLDFSERLDLPPIPEGYTTFENIVLATGRRCGMADSEWNLPGLDEVYVRGVVAASQGYTGQDFINGMRVAFPSDGSCFDGKINILLRGSAVDFELDDEFRVEEGSDAEQEEVLRNGDDQRKSPLRRPAKINLLFPNANLGYTLTKANAPNYGAPQGVVAEVTMEVPCVMDEETEAPQLADVLDKISRAEADGEVVRVFPDYLAAKAVPGSIIRLTDGTLQRRLRVQGVRTGDGTRRLSMWADRQHAYVSQVSAPSSAGWPTPPPSLPGETVAAFLDIPALVDENDALGIYVAISGQPGTAWHGARIEYRVQGFTTWTDLGTYTLRAIMGTLLADFPAGSEFYPDTANALEVELLQDDELESLSYEEWLAEQGAVAIVRADNSAEILQPRYAEVDSNQDWTLTHHQRGRLGTSTAAHLTGARFVVLDGVIFLPLPSSAIGKTLEFRVTALGGSPETAPVHTLTWTAAVQRELPVAYLQLTRGGGTIAGSWIERRRFGTDVNPIRSANWDGFRVTLTDGSVTETFDTTDTSFSRSDSAFSGPVTVTVQQLNRYTGAGPGTSEIA